MEATLITEQEAVLHLHLDIDLDNSPVSDPRYVDLVSKMYQAETIIVDYLKYVETGWDNQSVPGPVKASILLMLSSLWENRDGEGVGSQGRGANTDMLYDGGPISNLLRRLRDPAIA